METTTPKPFVFVVMPINPEFDDVYKLGIKAACEKAGTFCERLDEQIFDEGMLDRIFNQIAKADIIVADMSGQNPNVFYEVGYAHALGKRVVLLTQNAGDIPFDLKYRFHIEYGGRIIALREKLEERVRHYVAHPEEKAADADAKIDFYIAGVPLRAGGNYAAKYHHGHVETFELEIAAHYPSGPTKAAEFFPSLITPDTVESVPSSDTGQRRVTIPDHRCLHQFENPARVTPDGWTTLRFSLRLLSAWMNLDPELPLVFRVNRNGPTTETPIHVRFERRIQET